MCKQYDAHARYYYIACIIDCGLYALVTQYCTTLNIVYIITKTCLSVDDYSDSYTYSNVLNLIREAIQSVMHRYYYHNYTDFVHKCGLAGAEYPGVCGCSTDLRPSEYWF